MKKLHVLAFAVAAASPSGDLAVLDGAKAMAGVAVDLWADPSVLTAATEEWRSVTH